MPEDARPSRRISIFLVRASVDADGQFLARITVISDWMAGSATPRAVADPEEVVLPSEPGYETLSQARPSRCLTSEQASDLDIGAGAYGPSTEIRTRIDMPL